MMMNLDPQNFQEPSPYYSGQVTTVQIPVPFLRQETGLGDALKRLFSGVGVHQTGCSPCQQRQGYLNQRVRLFPW